MNYTKEFSRIREQCLRGSGPDIDRVLALLGPEVDLPTTRAVDFYLGLVENPEGVARIEHHLFHGTLIQRNYCTLYFSRRNEWELVNRAYDRGLIDRIQAYSR